VLLAAGLSGGRVLISAAGSQAENGRCVTTLLIYRNKCTSLTNFKGV
jgi:hypothetical protein